MTTTNAEARRGNPVRRNSHPKAAPFSMPLPSRVPEAERLYYFDKDAKTRYWIYTADKVALRLHYDMLRADLHWWKSQHNGSLRSTTAHEYVSSGLARRTLVMIGGMEKEIASVRALLPATHAPGSVPKHEPSVYAELAERGLTNVEIAALVDPPVSEAAVRRGLAKAGYKRTKSSPKAPRRAQRHADEKKS